MKFVLSTILLLVAFGCVVVRADAPAAEHSPKALDLKDSFQPGTRIEWDIATGRYSLGQEVHTRASLTVVAASDSDVSVRQTRQVVFSRADGAVLRNVSYDDRFGWDRAPGFLAPVHPPTGVDYQVSQVALDVAGRTREATLYHADLGWSFWYDAQHPGVLLKAERVETVTVRIDGRDVELQRAAQTITATAITLGEPVMAQGD